MPVSLRQVAISARKGRCRNCSGDKVPHAWVVVRGENVVSGVGLEVVVVDELEGLRVRNVTSISKPMSRVVACVYWSVLIRVSRLVRGQEGRGAPDSERQ